MTDREKLLVTLLGDDHDPADGPVTTLEVMAMLYELGDEHRRLSGDGPARIPA